VIFLLVLKKVWEWLKKYWKYILFPVGIVLGILGALSTRRAVEVTPSEVGEAEKEKRRAEEEAEEKVREAETKKLQRIQEIEEEHRAVIEQLTEEQQSRVEELRESPEDLNTFLLDVGKQIRG